MGAVRACMPLLSIAALRPPADTTSTNGPAELIGQPLSAIEKWAYQQTLKLTNGNREEVARILGIGERTVYRKLKEYDLQ